MSGMTHSYMRHDSFIYVTWLIPMYDTTRSFVYVTLSFIFVVSLRRLIHPFLWPVFLVFFFAFALGAPVT